MSVRMFSCCSYCTGPGHNIRTCETRKRSETQAAQLRAEREAQERREAQARQAQERREAWARQAQARREPAPPELAHEVRDVQLPPNMVTDEGLARMVALPVLRETAVEATECPICIEDLGETGKTVLKCGHTLCVSCFLQQVLRSTAMRSTNDCACPVCRVSYIM